MKRLILMVALLAAWQGAGLSQAGVKPAPVFVVDRPTILAFFHPMTEAEANSGEGYAEALDDFNYYAYKVEGRLKKAGIDFREVDVRSFRVRTGKRVRSFQTGPIGIGYYFIAPGKGPRIEYGVMTDEDLADAAGEYFGVAVPGEKCSGPHCAK